jgi:chromosome segregation ATPase
MLSTVLNLLKKPAARSDELRKALSEISSAEARANVERLEAERRRLLLDGSDKDIRAVEENLASARRDLDRANAATEELQRRIAETEAKEEADKAAAERKAIEDEAQAAADAIRKEYPVLARKLVDLLERVKAADEAVKEFNQRLVKSGQWGTAPHLRMESVQSRVFTNFNEQGWNGSLPVHVILPDIDANFAPGWNDQGKIHRGSMALKVA